MMLALFFASAAASAEELGCIETTITSAPIGANGSELGAEPRKRLPLVSCTVASDDGSPATLGIQLVDINELTISALFNGWAPKQMSELIGRREDIVDTPVAREVRDILSRFSEYRRPFTHGHVTMVFHDSEFIAGTSIEDPVLVDIGGMDYVPRDIPYNLARHGAFNSGVADLRYEMNPSSSDIEALRTGNWPAAATHWYGLQSAMRRTYSRSPTLSNRYRSAASAPEPRDAAAAKHGRSLTKLMNRKRDLIADTMVWRYMSEQDLANFHADQLRYRAHFLDQPLFDRRRRDSLPTFNMPDTFQKRELVVPRYFDAMGYFARGDLPLDFAPVFQGVYEGSWESFLFPRRLKLRIAVLSNASTRNISLRQLGLQQSRDVYLRRAESRGFPVPVPLARPNDGEWSLPPGGRLVVPLRIELAYEQEVVDFFADAAKARAAALHASIHDVPAGADVEYNEVSDWSELLWSSPLLVSRAGSFEPPVSPDMRSYIYETAITLDTIETRMGRVRMPGAEPAAVSLSFTAHSEGAQCPYLYVWDEEKSSFERLGKILVSSNQDYNARSDRVRIPRPTLRFQISEEENEVTFIERLTLVARHRDGRELRLSPANAAWEQGEQPGLVLQPGEAVEVDFALPTGVGLTDLTTTDLEIRGHYVRLGRLLLEANAARPR